MEDIKMEYSVMFYVNLLRNREKFYLVDEQNYRPRSIAKLQKQLKKHES
jgi:hypothetical protein